MCTTRDLWLAKRLLYKGKAPVQVSMAAPEKMTLGLQQAVWGLRGAFMQGSMPFLPAWETVGVETASLEGSRL